LLKFNLSQGELKALLHCWKSIKNIGRGEEAKKDLPAGLKNRRKIF
jgi:hypothetical protein